MKDSRSSSFKIVDKYDYTDADGRLLFQVVRLDPKDFRQRRPLRPGDPKIWKDPATGDEWVWKAVPDCELVLYRLPRVIEAIRRGEELWAVEGEKDVHALEAAGVTATCNPGGAGKWRKEYTEWLAKTARAEGCDGFLRTINLVIVRDKDDPADPRKPGRAHAQDLAWSFTEHSISWRAVEAAEGKDAHDHLVKYGHGLDEFVEIEVPAERPDRRNFQGYWRGRRRPRTYEVEWGEVERGGVEFQGWAS